MNDTYSVDLDLRGRVAVVTGAGRGIGRASALGLAAAGADLILISRTQRELASVAREARDLGATAEWFACDVTDAQQVDRAFAPIERVDILVNGAGGNDPEPFGDVSESTLERLTETNFKAAFRVTQKAVSRMPGRESGAAVVNISSQMGRVGAANRSVYCATKHALEGLTKALAIELAPVGIRVNAVAPTFIRTPMTAPYLANEKFRESVLERIPLGRIGEVDDVVGAVVFLSSPAARMITGASLTVDGGWTAQ